MLLPATLLLLLLEIPPSLSIAGQPGKPWSPGEVARTKERLWKIMNNPGDFINKKKESSEHGDCGKDCWKGCDAFDKNSTHEFCTHCDEITCPADIPECQCCRGWCDMPYTILEPSAPKFLRLSFHDCLKYKDGTGGCDGCLNWSNLGVRYQKKDEPSGNGPYDHSFDDPGDISNGKGDSNNMIIAVLALEHVFKDSNLGDNNLSLLEANKSRADLWALAGIVAVEFSVNENNLACSRSTLDWTQKGEVKMGCGRRNMNTSDCFVAMPKIPFRTGRVDCTPGKEPYMATKEEIHPSLFGNGPATIKWFEENFELTDPKEVVALMGAHTLGKVHQQNTLVKYFWTRGEHSYFNNQYYKTMVDKKDYAIQCIEKDFILIGEPDGSPGTVTWKAHGRGWMQSGGPFSWRRNLDLCYDGGIGKSGLSRLLPIFGTEEEVNRNCYNSSQQMVDGGPTWTCKDACYTPDDFVDELMLHADMGLYLDFTVDQKTGRQLGYGEDRSVTCPGLVNATPQSVKWDHAKTTMATKADCAEASTAHIVKKYATHQATWVKDFAAVFDKVLMNGYKKHSLGRAEYGCCTRVPPSRASSPKEGSIVDCDPAAVC